MYNTALRVLKAAHFCLEWVVLCVLAFEKIEHVLNWPVYQCTCVPMQGSLPS